MNRARTLWLTALGLVVLAVALFWSVTVTVSVVAAKVALGVPVIAPVDALMINPVGRAGATE